MERRWTSAQSQAITARGGNLLVSAAAGSGKTAVLVERVIRRLTDAAHPVTPDRFLIVTFTRAAASEIRTRISAALELAIAADRTNPFLARQQMLLPFAHICTIDAFCSALVKENFAALSLSPTVKTADAGELELLSAAALDQTLEAFYAEGDPAFLELTETVFQGRDDKALREAVLSLYTASVAYPFPALWLRQVRCAFDADTPLVRSPYGSVLLHSVRSALDYCETLLKMLWDSIGDDELLRALFSDAVQDDGTQLSRMTAALEKGDWDALCDAVLSYTPARRGRAPKGMGDDPAILYLASLREALKDVLKKKLPPLFASSEAEFSADMAAFAPRVDALTRVVSLYAETFRALKEERDKVDFNDIMHHALSLLVTADEDGNVQTTPLALSLRDQFEEILIDEYQDTNRAQDMLFEAISNGNLFRVGDVKQSIYRFRQAMPEIFMALKDAYRPYDAAAPVFPAKIVLKNNFRSRSSVTGAVNFVFSQVMSRQTGDVDYDGEEQLEASAPYPEKADDCCELHLLDIAALDAEEDDSDAFQADYVAKRIETLLSEGLTVTESGAQRRADYRDFCILLRSINGGRGVIYADALRKRGIPCYTEIAADFFSAPEVALLLNLLRVLDNPKQDVALLSVMMSVLFGFSVDETAALRVGCPQGDIYACLLAAKSEGNEKVTAFLQQLSLWRSLSVSMPLRDLLVRIYEETAIVSVVSALHEDSAKKRNLMLLLDYAKTYEDSGYLGLSGFIRFIDRLERSGGDLAGAVGVSADANVVRIMSIHKSKGLEFPVCIVAGCATRFNRSDENKNLIVHPRLGVGIKQRDLLTLSQVPTVCHRAVQTALRDDMMSEELRVLYVAMTRAKERLLLVCAAKGIDRVMEKYRARLCAGSPVMAPFAAANAASYADWLLPAFARHPDGAPLREAGGLGDDMILPAQSRLRVFCKSWSAPQASAAPPQTVRQADEAFLAALREKLAWEYPFLPLTKLVSKRAASEVDKRFIDRDYFASSRPAFLTEGRLSAAEKGTATHTFMQFADYENARRDVDSEIARLCERGHISAVQAAAINRAAVRRFFESALARRMMGSELLLREKQFTVEVPVTRLYAGMEAFADEKVLIQGIADCAFLEDGKLVVVDYKTDRLQTAEAFAEKYAGQVRIYKEALEQCTGYEVKQTLLYSFYLSREIEVPAV